MRERTNIMLDIGLKQSLQRLSNKTKMSLSDLINQRLSGSLSVEERIGEKPEWMRNLDPISPITFQILSYRSLHH
ncbi:hypothetical protein [Klebsiella pneumoniae]|uniref:hypothetical protein n=1 Tax=Klebsiella pneumoniae TaxID=573 RepID=UPI0022B6E7EF|nr:hypothetical protein [Klebsiella pneumoniae]